MRALHTYTSFEQPFKGIGTATSYCCVSNNTVELL